MGVIEQINQSVSQSTFLDSFGYVSCVMGREWGRGVGRWGRERGEGGGTGHIEDLCHAAFVDYKP